MEDIIGILFYDSFIKLPESNQTLGENKDSFYSPGHIKQVEKNMLHDART